MKTKVTKEEPVFVFCIGLVTLIGICGNVECDTMSIEQGIYIASAVIVLLAIDVITIRWIQREEGGGESEMYDMHKSLEREHLAETAPKRLHMPEVQEKSSTGRQTKSSREIIR